MKFGSHLLHADSLIGRCLCAAESNAQHRLQNLCSTIHLAVVQLLQQLWVNNLQHIISNIITLPGAGQGRHGWTKCRLPLQVLISSNKFAWELGRLLTSGSEAGSSPI